MPPLIRLYIRQVLIGFALGAAFTALLLWSGVGGLWHLVTHTAEGPLAVVLLVLFNGIVFAGVQFGIAVMRMAEPDEPRGGRRAPPTAAMRPAAATRTVPVKARP